MLKHKLVDNELHIEFEDIFELKISNDSLLQNNDITIKNVKDLYNFVTVYKDLFECGVPPLSHDEKVILVFGDKAICHSKIRNANFDPIGPRCESCYKRNEFNHSTAQFCVTNKGKIMGRWVLSSTVITSQDRFCVCSDLNIVLPNQVIKILTIIGEDVLNIGNCYSASSGFTVTKAANIIRSLCELCM